MTAFPRIFLLAITLALACAPARAYEEEDAVALTLGTLDYYNEQIGKVDLALDGSNVTFTLAMQNRGNARRRLGFYAYTPFFGPPQIAEDHQDKDFPSLKVTLDGAPVKAARYVRRLFGAQRYVARSWAHTLAPRSDHVQTISYRALPQFGREQIGSARLAYLVAQHCGDLEQVTRTLAARVPGLAYLLFERYQIAASFLPSRAVTLSVAQPAAPGAGKRALITLACGLAGRRGDGADFTAGLADPGSTVSVLVLSSFAGSIVE